MNKVFDKTLIILSIAGWLGAVAVAIAWSI
jgi:hypothetical protein